MTNGNSAERERFEKWCGLNNFGATRQPEGERFADYVSLVTERSWQAWQARAAMSVCADGGKGEAVAPVGKVLSESEMGIAFDRSRGGNVVWFGTPQPGFLYTVPQAECAPRTDEKRCEYCDGTGCVHRIDGEYLGECTECAPREAQPVVEAMQAYLRQCRVGGMPKDVSDQIERAVNQANHLGYFAAPTPECADAKKDAALTDEQIEAAIEAWFDTDEKDVDDHQSRMRAAILAADKA
jgi:hypothetical protein